MANMSTVTVADTFILFIKEALDGIYSHQGLLLLNIWRDTTAYPLDGWSRAQTWCKSVLRSVAANPDVTPS